MDVTILPMRDGELLEHAKSNRRQMPKGEVILWYYLRRGRMGARFRRQHVVGPCILDFAALDIRLNIEADGSQHLVEEDKARDRYLESRGWTVLRYSNDDIYNELEGVLRDIKEAMARLTRRS